MQPMTSVPPHDAAVAMSAADEASCEPAATLHLQNGTIVRRLRQAYDAMFLFLHTYWERTGRHADEKLAPLLADCRSHRGRTSVKDAKIAATSEAAKHAPLRGIAHESTPSSRGRDEYITLGTRALPKRR
jgi:hypothetical protein